MLKTGDKIVFLRDVTAPPRQAGRTGEQKAVGSDISEYDANYLQRGGYVTKDKDKERKKSNAGNDSTGDQKSDN